MATKSSTGRAVAAAPPPTISRVAEIQILIVNEDGSEVRATRGSDFRWTINGKMWPRFLRMLDEIQGAIRQAEHPT